MEYQKITNLLDNEVQINQLNLKQKIGLKKTMNQEEYIKLIVKLSLV